MHTIIAKSGRIGMKPIYKPKGAAAEYGDYAANIKDSLQAEMER